MTRILSLDDCRQMGDLVAMVLERKGYQCVITDDSYEAWALLHTLPFDLFTQDLARWDVDGFEFYHLMRADASLDDVPIVMVTARPRPEDSDQVFDAGLDGYLTKPFGPQELWQTIADVLRERGKPLPAGPGKKADPFSTMALVERLDSEQSAERLWAAQELGLRTDERSVEISQEPLLIHLQDPDAGVRWAAALALGRIGAPCAVEPLIAVLGDEDDMVRMMAAHALGKIGDPRAGAALTERLDDESTWVQMAAVPALGKVKSAEAVPGLVRILHDAAGALKRESAHALGQIGGPGVDSLLACLNAEAADVRRLALTNLVFADQDPRIEEALLTALGDVDAQVRRSAAQLLGRWSSSQAVDSLIAALEDESADVAADAAYALGEIGNPRALPALEQVARQDKRRTFWDHLVSRLARQAIERIKEGSECVRDRNALVFRPIPGDLQGTMWELFHWYPRLSAPRAHIPFVEFVSTTKFVVYDGYDWHRVQYRLVGETFAVEEVARIGEENRREEAVYPFGPHFIAFLQSARQLRLVHNNLYFYTEPSGTPPIVNTLGFRFVGC